MSGRRQGLYLEYAEMTSRLRTAAEAGELAEVALLVASRQRLIEEARRIDGPREPLTLKERRALEQAMGDERRAHDQLAQRRQRIVAELREVVRVQRARRGYLNQPVNAPAVIDRRG